MKFSLEGKTALITGGGSGIGKAIAVAFAQQGALVGVLDFNGEAAKETVGEIHELGKKAMAFACDVSDRGQVQEVVRSMAVSYGLHILVNNAGIAHVGNIEAVQESDLDRLYQVNIKGVYNGISAAIPYFKEQGNGVILNLASVAASVGISDRFAYSMTKGAVRTMTFSVAKDYISHGIRCNCISPGRVHTPFVDGFIQKNYPGQEDEMFKRLALSQPIGRMALPVEIADLALFLCSEEAKFITGSDYPIDGGFIKLNS
jgi:2-keto-3-deoxy-L-fuconate dehydrogenase